VSALRTSVTAALMAALLVPTMPLVAQDHGPEQAVTADEADAFYCGERRLGYWFYCTRPKRAQPREQGPAPQTQSATAQLEAVTAELRELKAQAIIEPTPQNVTAYIRFQREQLDRASLFSDVWQRAIWQDPELDYTLQRPVSTLGKRQWQDARSSERDAVMARLSQRYGLFYFFAQSCGACEVMSPIVQGVAATWHVAVRAISTDGGPSRHLPNLHGRDQPAQHAWGSSPRSPRPSCCGMPPRARRYRSATA